jgi:transposase, IS6 family
VIINGHALIQNLRRGHYKLGTETDPQLHLAAAFNEIGRTI